MNSDLISFLDRSPYGDPNRNYNMLHNRVKELKEKHLPYKFVKFNKHRHKNSSWITQGVIKSIRYRDKLYRELKSSDRSSPRQKEVLHLTPCLKIADTVIENVNEFNFLGVHLDSHMTWKSHTDKLALKLSKYTGILNKLEHYLPSIISYFTLIHSHLNYAVLTWGYKCNRLNKLQKRLIRVVTSSKYNAHTDPLFKITQILKLQDLLNLNALKFYYRYLHETLPSFFYCFGIATQGAHHSHDTRQRDQIRTHRSRTDNCENRLRVYLPKLINSTRLDLLQKITTHSIQGFSSGIKNNFLCKYDDSCCYICRHNGQ